MAEVTGPISSLPGAYHSLPKGTMCDEHPDRPAVARVQGETDCLIFRNKTMSKSDIPEGFELYIGSFKSGYGNGKPPKNTFSHKPGCYVIEHVATGKKYVGSSVNLSGRINGNLNYLEHGKHKNKNLQEAFNNDPKVEVFVKPTKTEEEARQLEQQIVDELLPSGNLCNIAVVDVTKTRVGVLLTDKHKSALLEGSLGKTRSPESRKRMSESHLGKKLPEEHKHKLSEVHKQRLSTPEGKESHAKGIEKISHAVMIDGIEYPSKSEAARILDLHVTTVMYRLKSPNFPNCHPKEEK